MTTLTATVTEHARLDSFPLRWGFSVPKKSMISLSNIRNMRKQGEEKYRVTADFNTPEGPETQTGTFVIVEDRHGNARIITAWRHDSKTEEGLSDLMVDLRYKGELTVANLYALHPKYVKGDLRTTVDLIASLAELKAAITITAAAADAYDKGFADAEAQNVKVIEVESKTKKQDAAWTESEFKYQGKLKKVEVVKDKYDQMVLKLLLDNGSFRQTKWDQETIIDRAKAYRDIEGQEIETTVSNTSTSTWSGSRFFNSVRVVNGVEVTTEETLTF